MKETLLEKMVSWIGSPASVLLHTIAFIGFFVAAAFGFISWDRMLLFLTTIVSLEAIYLAIFIQMTVNQNTRSLKEVEEDIDEIQEDVEELGEDIDEIQEDIDEIQEDVEEITEEEAAEKRREEASARNLEALTNDVRKVLADLEALKKGDKA